MHEQGARHKEALNKPEAELVRCEGINLSSGPGLDTVCGENVRMLWKWKQFDCPAVGNSVLDSISLATWCGRVEQIFLLDSFGSI